MGWVTTARDALLRKEGVEVRPFGGSMRGRIESGQLVKLEPATGRDVSVGDVVFVRWGDSFLLHLVKEINVDRLLIGNNLGKTNGWVPLEAVLGKVTQVSD